MKKSFIFFSMVALAAAVWFGACSRKQSEAADTQASKGKKPPLVTVMPALKQDIASVICLTGFIEPTRVACMASPAEGPIVVCSVREGDSVAEGQVLVEVGRTHAAVAAVTAAREELNKQMDEFDRIQQLVGSGAVPGDQLDIAKANIEKARAALVAAETAMGDFSIEAPWNGIVSKVWIAEGNYVAPRVKLIEMFDPESLVVRFAVPETNAAQVKQDSPLNIRIDAYPERMFRGEIVRVYPELDRGTSTRTVEAAIPGGPALIPGMFVRIDLTTAVVREATIVLESAVLANSKNEKILFVVNDGKAQLRKIQTGIQQENRIQILEGVSSGEKVIVAGNEGLKDGMAIRTGENKPREAATMDSKG